MKGFAWIREHRRSAVGLVLFVAGGFVTAVINKIIENNDLEWLKAIWRGAWGFVVGVYDWFFSSAPIPVWLALLVAALALVPVWQLAKKVRVASTTTPEAALTRTQTMVLGAVQAMDEVRKYNATLPAVIRQTTLAPLEAEAALDHLTSIDFISCSWAINGPSGYTVLPAGRSYLLDNVFNRDRSAHHA